jgi:hypothetical protein
VNTEKLDETDRVVEIEQLAALEPLEYEIAREAAAKRLKVRAATLDKLTQRKRRELGLDKQDDDAGQGRAVKIADVLPWHDPVAGDHVAMALAAAVKTYSVMSDEAADAIAIWVLHSWTVNRFSISPRLAIVSPTKGCGKTTILNILSKVTRRPKTSGSVTPAALFRAIEIIQPTFLLDENEKYMEAGGDLHALLNEGHRKGATVLRVLGDKQELREFSVFGAVALARNGRLPDDLEQRSIVIEMRRRRPDQTLETLRDDRCESLNALARMCVRWADDVDLTDIDPNMAGLINRDSDNWRPLFAIAEAIGEDWPDRIRQAAAALVLRESESTGPMLLGDIRAAFDEKGSDRLASADLCEALATMEGRPWAEWRAGRGAAPKPITPNQLAKVLRPFGISPVNLRIGVRVPKGYGRDQFEESWSRYLAQEGLKTDSEPLQRYNADGIDSFDTFQGATPEKCSGSNRYTELPVAVGVAVRVAVQNDEKAPLNGPCSGVAVHTGVVAPIAANGSGTWREDQTCAQCRGAVDGTE